MLQPNMEQFFGGTERGGEREIDRDGEGGGVSQMDCILWSRNT